MDESLSIDGAYQQLVDSRQAWQGMYCKRTKNNTLYIGVSVRYICVCQLHILIYIGVCHESVYMSG